MWEYDVIFIGDPGSGAVKARERLNEAGREGWELVSYVEGYGLFKRSQHGFVYVCGCGESDTWTVSTTSE